MPVGLKRTWKPNLNGQEPPLASLQLASALFAVRVDCSLLCLSALAQCGIPQPSP